MEEDYKLIISRRINDNMFVTAYELLICEIEKVGITEEIIEVSKEISKSIRYRAAYYAAKHQDLLGKEMESLLRLVIRINGEGIYE